MKYYQTVDANVNRVAEGVRVLEDLARYQTRNRETARKLRELRHEVRRLAGELEIWMQSQRDTATDPGIQNSQKQGAARYPDQRSMAAANAKRVQEGLRSLVEHLKLLGEVRIAEALEAQRYRAYDLEQELLRALRPPLPEGIYGIITGRFCRGRPVEEVARAMLEGGIAVIQYREKNADKDHRTMLEECRVLRRLTAEYGVPFIVNDHPQLALLAQADGLHVGQDDLPPAEVRRLVGGMMIGLSTHSPEQAEAACTEDVDYLGIGPVFGTNIKPDVCDPVGLEYVDFAAAHVAKPWVAIGGIKEHNIESVIEHGARTVCLVSEILEADDIRAKVERLRSMRESHR